MLVGRIERNATPRRLASEMGSQANSALAVPPLPASMLRFSGQGAGQPGARQPGRAAEEQQPSAAQKVLIGAAAAAGAGLAAAPAAGRAAAEATSDSPRV